MSNSGEINPVSGSPVDPQLHDPFAYRLNVSKVADRNPRKPGFDPRAGLPVFQTLQPVNEWSLAGRALVVAKFKRIHCNL